MPKRQRVFDRVSEELYRAEVVFLSHLAPWNPGAQLHDISPSHGMKLHCPELRQYPLIGQGDSDPGNLGTTGVLCVDGDDAVVVVVDVVVLIVVVVVVVDVVCFVFCCIVTFDFLESCPQAPLAMQE